MERSRNSATIEVRHVPDREETAMEREPLHSYGDRPEETHARANLPRAIDARRNILVGATIAAILLIIVLVLVL
jgi:hypothetical protein